MREVVVSSREAGQRFDKYLKKYFKEAGSGFIYKMLRKKNIVLNDCKATGSEQINSGDVIKFYLADDTIAKFTGSADCQKKTDIHTPNKKSDMVIEEKDNKKYIVKSPYRVEIIYEDDDVIFFNKPAGLLSQKAEKNDISLVDILTDYLQLDGEASGYKPGICNRLDRNTSGIVAAGKSVRGLRALSDTIRDRKVEKIYRCVVCGRVKEGAHLKGYLVKDEASNKVYVTDTFNLSAPDNGRKEQYIETIYKPLGVCELGTILQVILVTGKSHQIRAHLAGTGHPIVGDVKYGAPKVRQTKHHLLHAYEMKFGTETDVLSGVSEKSIVADYPDYFKKIINSGTGK
ncbi:MAG: RluA family pseudouridine synthase [Lachnospiraceae bacterium]|nr:RluA family pseudouridine synthase [Lachnospiraceae bacterium]